MNHRIRSITETGNLSRSYMCTHGGGEGVLESKMTGRYPFLKNFRKPVQEKDLHFNSVFRN